jgi:mono/diheme cytochrome c family protein
MNRISMSLILIAGVGLSSFGLAQTIVKQVPARPTASVDGKTLYREFCAACHGADGKGEGPAAVALKDTPTDLTRIASENHGAFPEERMLHVFNGQERPAAHGTPAMPIWGTVLSNLSPNLEMAQMRVHALLDYLEKIQVK